MKLIINNAIELLRENGYQIFDFDAAGKIGELEDDRQSLYIQLGKALTVIESMKCCGNCEHDKPKSLHVPMICMKCSRRQYCAKYIDNWELKQWPTK